jgi:hypothetical protein
VNTRYIYQKNKNKYIFELSAYKIGKIKTIKVIIFDDKIYRFLSELWDYLGLLNSVKQVC